MTYSLGDDALDHLRTVIQDDAPDDPRYRIVRRIGQGGMGTVYLAEDCALGRTVALKVTRDGVLDPRSIDRLFREARVIARLEHPGIVPVHDIGTLADGRVFYVMKWIQGRRLDEHFQASAGFPERLRVFQRICETVAFAHAHGVLHRDLNPGCAVGEQSSRFLSGFGGCDRVGDSARRSPRSQSRCSDDLPP